MSILLIIGYPNILELLGEGTTLFIYNEIIESPFLRIKKYTDIQAFEPIIEKRKNNYWKPKFDRTFGR